MRPTTAALASTVRRAAWAAGSTLVMAALLAQAPASAQSLRPDAQDVREIKTRFQNSGLASADVKIAADGRVELIGDYQDRNEVQVAFSLAQQVVGVKWVAPTTPENVQYPIENSVELFRQAMRKGKLPSALPAAAGRVGKYAVVVGVKDFQDRHIQRLAYSARDAELFRDFLVSADGGRFPQQNVTLLTDRQATKRNIEAALDQVARRAQPGDIVVVYFSTHGTPLNDRANMGIVAYDTEVTPRHKIFHTSVSDEKLSSFIDSLRQSQVMIVLDTCYSGMAFAKVPGFLATGAKDLFVEEDRHMVQGIPQQSLQNLAVGGKDSIAVGAAEAGQPAAAQGATKILVSASDATQKSWESERLKNGFFTYHFIQGLKARRNVAGAYDYAKPVVMQEVQREKKQVQTPQAVFIPSQANIEM